MQSKIITTFSFLLPPRPWEMRMISALRKGVDGQFGVIIEPVIDRETIGTTCAFFEIDVRSGSMTQHEMAFPYRVLLQMDLCYDESRQAWITTPCR